jgi:uncharacterized membrane protein YbhN (UPF0104 family)
VKPFLRIAKAAIGVTLLGWLLASVDYGELADSASQGDPALLALGLLMLLLSQPVFQGWRLHVLIEGYTRTWATTARIFFVGSFFNNILPSNVGGDAVRLMYLQRMRGGNWGAPLALLMLHRLSGISVILLIAVVYLLFAERHAIDVLSDLGVRGPSLGVLAAAVALAAAAAAALLFIPGPVRAKVLGRTRKLAGDFVAGWREVTGAAMTWLSVLTVAYHVTRLFGFLYIIQYMGQDVGLGELVMVMTVTAVLALVPVTVGALGVMEGSITLMLGAYGVSHPAAVAVALANRMVLLLSALIGGVVYVTEKKRESVPPPAPDQAG